MKEEGKQLSQITKEMEKIQTPEAKEHNQQAYQKILRFNITVTYHNYIVHVI